MLGQRAVTVTVDRTFLGEGVRWIIALKGSYADRDVDGFLDRERQRYREQMVRCAHIFRMMEPRPVRVGLYFPLLCGWRELDVGD
jgi:hypothetical protein